MSTSTQLLLLETVESLGIVGDIVKVKRGYARNYLLPMGLAEPPTPTNIESLRHARDESLSELGALRTARLELLGRMEEVAVEMTRSCNDQGVLYGSVTQQDIASALGEVGFQVKPREVRLSQSIKRIDTYEVLVRFDADLETPVKIWVVPDREFETDEREEMDFDNEGNLIEKRERKRTPRAEDKAEDKAETANA